eukprot:TRINITY_DN7042_c0_g2_i2.p1 TRINITY_DN7042_c0_g2~~TRINITY_DN7042_c0_g2_i2.p1  ORF type:complete len:237 (-),score=52.33 TRINITY_DN7042_c0_g2_i2:89-799(-)
MGVCGSKYKGPSPCLHEYFAQQIAFARAELKNAQTNFEEAIALSQNPEAFKKKREDSQEKLWSILLPLIEKSFDHHDTLQNGVLEPEESRVFCQHYVDEQSEFIVSLQGMVQRETMQQVMKAMSGMGLKDNHSKEQMEARVAYEMSKIHGLVQKQVAAYVEDKVNRDLDAFAVIDVNGDGKLQKDEVVQAMLPNTPKNLEFLNALGVNPEALAKQQLQQMGISMEVDANKTECKQM